jgi:hypothetical protein
VAEAGRAWLAIDFDRWLHYWVGEYSPTLTAIRNVRDWIRAREENPFEGAHPVPDKPGLMFGTIPGTLDDDNRVVTCSYWILREDGVIRCDMISTKSWPV